MKKVIIIRGPLGVGKSTVAKRLAAILHGCYICVDEVLSEHRLDESEDGIPVENFIKANEFIVDVVKGAECQEAVVIDGNFYYQVQLDDLVTELGGNVNVFSLMAPLKICLQRDAGRNKVYGEDATRAVYELVSKVKSGTEIDTENKTEGQVVDEIAAQLEDKS